MVIEQKWQPSDPYAIGSGPIEQPINSNPMNKNTYVSSDLKFILFILFFANNKSYKR